MTKVKCDVQIVVTGPTASGKTLITTRILTAIQSYADLSVICKVMPSRSFEGICQDVTGLRFEGELPQAAIVEEPVANPIEVFFFHDVDDGWYHAKLPNGESINRNNWKELKYSCECRVPMATFEWSKDNPKTMDLYRPAELAKPERAPHSDDTADPVGSPAQSENAAPALHSGPSGGIKVTVINHSGEESPKIVIDADSTKHNFSKFERLPGESNSEYHQRYRDHMTAKQAERDSRDKAFDTLQAVAKAIPAQFYPHHLIKNSMLRGDYWVIFSDGSLVPVRHFIYYPEVGEREPVYYAERETRKQPVVLDHVGNRQDAASPAKDAHITDDPLHNVMLQLGTFPPEHREQFKANVGEFPVAISPKCLVQVLFKDGTVGQRLAGDCNWSLKDFNAVIFYRPI